MTHTVQNKSKLLARVRRLKGQMEAIERALEAETSCAEILNLAASVRGATNGLVVELLEDHLRNHVVGVESDALRAAGADELVEVMRRHLK
ncbi:metal/formaldehyde-sensitive transcriptional repressor [Albidovulum sp.]|uniref:metal/formaldehyde-sensitive transcriptional repressor n=1 Tax=Albidovulum sp. TaxID=1872424 RepID=UPI0039B9A9EE